MALQSGGVVVRITALSDGCYQNQLSAMMKSLVQALTNVQRFVSLIQREEIQNFDQGFQYVMSESDPIPPWKWRKKNTVKAGVVFTPKRALEKRLDCPRRLRGTIPYFGTWL